MSLESPLLNIAGYCFFSLNQPEEIREELRSFCIQEDIKGTILLSTEGCNLYLSGLPENIEKFSHFLFERLKFPSFEFKKSWSAKHPYSRMLVKIKQEIISTGFPEILPHKKTAPHMSAQELKKLYETEKDFVVLDTRNDYEIKLGKFKNAVDLKIASFRDFFNEASKLPDELKGKKVVTYCTGGIRCEKASAYMMEKLGFENVYQLDGGILKYFEENGDDHYEGECFVFDKRVGVNGALEETQTQQCFACRAPLLEEDLKSELYKESESCPHCFHIKKEERLKAYKEEQLV